MKFNKTILKNGLRIVTVPMTDNPSVTVLVMVAAGSKYETKEINGISHFLEHMVFKGTPSRPNSIDIAREFDSIGAQHNAFTSYEYTGYYAKADNRHTDKILDIISDMYINPLLKTEDIEKEKGVIVEEIRMYQDLPQAKVGYVLMELMFGDQPVAWNLAGTEETVKSFTREQIVSYRTANYVPSHTTVIVAGSFDEGEMIKKIEDTFSGLPAGAKSDKLKVIESQSAPQIKTFYKETDQTHVVIGLRTFAVNDPRKPILRVLTAILGKGMSSRLFSKMRDDLGICYYISADQDSFTDHGILTISAGVDNSRVEEGIKGILEECRRMKNEIVPEIELQKAKDLISGSTMLNLETSDAQAEFCGHQEIMKGEVESAESAIAKVNSVTAEQVQNLAKEIFVDKSLNLAIVGKFKDGEEFKKYFTLM